MNRIMRVAGRWAIGLVLAIGLAASAVAATYNISLFQGATGTGSGAFTFTNSGTAGSFAITPTLLATNASSSVGVITWPNVAGLSVVVQAVSFSDGKTPPNQITGNFVEGLTGSLTKSNVGNDTFPGVTGCTANGSNCSATITFSYTACAPPGSCNPGTATKAYTIVVRDKFNVVLTTVNGTYGVTNSVHAAPEPSALLLAAIALLALTATRLRLHRPVRDRES